MNPREFSLFQTQSQPHQILSESYLSIVQFESIQMKAWLAIVAPCLILSVGCLQTHRSHYITTTHLSAWTGNSCDEKCKQIGGFPCGMLFKDCCNSSNECTGVAWKECEESHRLPIDCSSEAPTFTNMKKLFGQPTSTAAATVAPVVAGETTSSQTSDKPENKSSQVQNKTENKSSQSSQSKIQNQTNQINQTSTTPEEGKTPKTVEASPVGDAKNASTQSSGSTQNESKGESSKPQQTPKSEKGNQTAAGGIEKPQPSQTQSSPNEKPLPQGKTQLQSDKGKGKNAQESKPEIVPQPRQGKPQKQAPSQEPSNKKKQQESKDQYTDKTASKKRNITTVQQVLPTKSKTIIPKYINIEDITKKKGINFSPYASNGGDDDD